MQSDLHSLMGHEQTYALRVRAINHNFHLLCLIIEEGEGEATQINLV